MAAEKTRARCVIGSLLGIAAILILTAAAAPGDEQWTFDRLDRVGGHPTTILGHPRVVDTPVGKAIEFDGVGDALMLDVHPLEGADTFTWEAIFRPDGGRAEQRWFHLQESGSDNRMLFEIRVVDGSKWFLDSYLHTPRAQHALINRQSLHPVGAWYHVASVYDGREFRNYVNGVLDGAHEMPFEVQSSGRTSIGVRINLVNYFKGAIHLARFTKRPLPVTEFLPIPAAKTGNLAVLRSPFSVLRSEFCVLSSEF